MKFTCTCGTEYHVPNDLEDELNELTKTAALIDLSGAEKERAQYLVQKLQFIRLCTVSICPACVTKREAEIRPEEKSVAAQKEIEDYDKMGILPEHYGATLENWEQRSENDVTAIIPALRAMLKAKRGIIVMTGPNGLGKTHLAAAMLKILGGRYFRWNRLTAYINSGYKDDAGFSVYGALELLGRIPLLVIDEFDKSTNTETKTNYLSDITDDRYARHKPTIFITNNHLVKNCPNKGTYPKGCPDCLDLKLTKDVLDRIDQVGVILTFSGESYRKVLRGK